MKINGSDLQSKLSVYQTAQTKRNTAGAVNGQTQRIGATVAQQDRVDFSERGWLIAEAQRAVATIPDVREALVSRVRTELDNGTYVFDNQKAAEGILRESMVNQAAMI